MWTAKPSLRLLLGSLMVSLIIGCGGEAPPKAELPTPFVTVDYPTEAQVPWYEYFTGRIEAIERVEVRAQVSGMLLKAPFVPGSEVVKDETVLFEIDPEPFKAAVDTSQAELEKAEARVVRTTADFRRLEKLKGTGAFSQEERDKAFGDMKEAEAAVRGFQAKLRSDKINLSYCTIKAPISGRIGDKLITEKNYITGGSGNATLLTTILSQDPVYLSFDIDENSLQKLRKAEKDGRTKSQSPGEIPAELGLAIDGDQYPYRGMIKFANNEVDPKTGTIRIKAEFSNPLDQTQKRPLIPGYFARVRIPIGEPKRSTLIPEKALLSELGTKYIYVVDKDNKAIRLDVELGVRSGEMRVVEAVRIPGETASRPLAKDERVIISGMQRVRPDMIVEPKTPSTN